MVQDSRDSQVNRVCQDSSNNKEHPESEDSSRDRTLNSSRVVVAEEVNSNSNLCKEVEWLTSSSTDKLVTNQEIPNNNSNNNKFRQLVEHLI